MKLILLLVSILCRKLVFSGCPPQWKSVQNMCFKLAKNETNNVSWGLAQEGCMQFDGRAHLPLVKNAEGWKILQEAIKKVTPELPQSTADETGNYIPLGGYKLNGQWYWLDDSEIDFNVTPWQPQEPSSNSENIENCLGISIAKTAGVSHIGCGGNYFYLCQMNAEEDVPLNKNNNSVSMTMSVPSEDKENTIENELVAKSQTFARVGGVFYMLLSDGIYTREIGYKKCQEKHTLSTLPEFHNLNDYHDFLHYVSDHATLDHQNIMLSPTRITGNKQFANQNAPLDFTNWAPNQPFEYEVHSNCVVALDLNGFTWEAVDCETQAFIICQIDQRSVMEPIITTTVTLPIRPSPLPHAVIQHGGYFKL